MDQPRTNWTQQVMSPQGMRPHQSYLNFLPVIFWELSALISGVNRKRWFRRWWSRRFLSPIRFKSGIKSETNCENWIQVESFEIVVTGHFDSEKKKGSSNSTKFPIKQLKVTRSPLVFEIRYEMRSHGISSAERDFIHRLSIKLRMESGQVS